MSVQFFEWGISKGGMSPSGSPTIPDEAGYGDPETFEGVLAVGDTTISFSKSTKSVHIVNTHDTIALEYNFDGIWIGLAPYGEITEPVSVSSLLLRGAGATYEITAALRS